MGLVALHPGKVLLEALLERDWTLSELAGKLDVRTEFLRDFLLERADMTSELAAKIASVIGSSEQFWVNLQSHFDACQANPNSTVPAAGQK